MWINKVTYGPIVGGINDGVPAFHIHFTGEEFDQKSSVEDIDAIMAIREFPDKSGAYSVVVLEAPLPPLSDDPFLLTLVRTLKSWHYYVQVKTHGRVYRTWFLPDAPGSPGLINCLTVEISDKPWPGFIADELHYFPSEGEIFEPYLPQDPVSMRLFLAGNHADEEIYAFLKKSKHPWTILNRHSPLSVLHVWAGEDRNE